MSRKQFRMAGKVARLDDYQPEKETEREKVVRFLARQYRRGNIKDPTEILCTYPEVLDYLNVRNRGEMVDAASLKLAPLQVQVLPIAPNSETEGRR